MMISYGMKKMSWLHTSIVMTFISIYCFGRGVGGAVVVPGRDDSGRLALFNSFQTTRKMYDTKNTSGSYQLTFNNPPWTWAGQYHCLTYWTPNYNGVIYPIVGWHPCNDEYKRPWVFLGSSTVLKYRDGAVPYVPCLAFTSDTPLPGHGFILENCNNVDAKKQSDFIQKWGVDVLTCASGYDIGLYGCEGMFNKKEGVLILFIYRYFCLNCMYVIL
jgi:hypothetical protein